MKKALVVGIDSYPKSPLRGCVNDAIEVAEKLGKNGNGSPNFSVSCLTSNNEEVTSAKLMNALKSLFQGNIETVLFYFSGHGTFDPETNTGHLVSQDGDVPNWGIPLSAVLSMANDAYPMIKSTVLILDSCRSGFAGQVSELGGESGVSVVNTGVTILSACDKNGYAIENNGHGVFTSILLDGLRGASADVLGRITPASLYAHVDQTLGPWEQRPIYKANVQSFITLREVDPKVPPDVLRRFPDYFPDPRDVYKLDPTFESNRGEEAERLKSIPVNEDNVRIYRDLQLCCNNGLITPVGQKHMWHAAVHSTGCKLTETGMHYWKLAEMERI